LPSVGDEDSQVARQGSGDLLDGEVEDVVRGGDGAGLVQEVPDAHGGCTSDVEGLQEGPFGDAAQRDGLSRRRGSAVSSRPAYSSMRRLRFVVPAACTGHAIAVPTDPNFAPSAEEALMALSNMWAYGLELAEQRRRRPGEDLMSRIVEAYAEEKLNDDELQGLTVMFAGAGADTTRNSLSHGLHALLQHPDQMAWLRQHAEAIPVTAIREIVRWASPVIHFSRTATHDTVVHGQQIEKGEKVTMLFASANFDETVISDPLIFDLSRDPNPHLSFGVGPHTCLGKHIAAIVIRVFFEELLKQTAHIEQLGPIGYVRDNFFRGVWTLPVSVTAAQDSGSSPA
jgi:cytochrome P450